MIKCEICSEEAVAWMEINDISKHTLCSKHAEEGEKIIEEQQNGRDRLLAFEPSYSFATSLPRIIYFKST